MQKKLFYYLFYRKRYVKFFQIMRLCFLFVFLGMLSATAKTIAQEQLLRDTPPEISENPLMHL